MATLARSLRRLAARQGARIVQGYFASRLPAHRQGACGLSRTLSGRGTSRAESPARIDVAQVGGSGRIEVIENIGMA